MSSKFERFNRSGIAFLDGTREKGNIHDLYGMPVTVSDYGFMSNENGTYVAFTVNEQPGKFYFGNKIVTELFQDVEGAGMDIREASIMFSGRISPKWGTEYTVYSIE